MLRSSLSRALVALAVACAVACGLGCQEPSLSGMDLQSLKRQTIQEGETTLTDEEKNAILGIRANTRSEYDEEVNRILEESRSQGNAQ